MELDISPQIPDLSQPKSVKNGRKITQRFALPPGSLHVQLALKRRKLGFTQDQFALGDISTPAIRELEEGNGLFSLYCKLMREWRLTLDIRSWDYQSLIEPEWAAWPDVVGEALGRHRDALLKQGSSDLPGISPNDRIAVEWADEDVTLRQVDEYLNCISASARLVRNPAAEVSGSPRRRP
jgi:hypothetical protein